MSSPLRSRRDYSSDEGKVNPYLNTPPTVINKKNKTTKDKEKRKLMQDALNTYRDTYGNPMVSNEINEIMDLLKTAVNVLESEKNNYEEYGKDVEKIFENYIKRLEFNAKKMKEHLAWVKRDKVIFKAMLGNVEENYKGLKYMTDTLAKIKKKLN